MLAILTSMSPLLLPRSFVLSLSFTDRENTLQILDRSLLTHFRAFALQNIPDLGQEQYFTSRHYPNTINKIQSIVRISISLHFPLDS